MKFEIFAFIEFGGQFRRNGRWGTCVDCPKIEGRAYPELCVNTERGDHNLTLEELVEHYRIFVSQ